MAIRRKPIPVCLLTGYLGSGKTTLMNNILNQQQGYHVAVIVNDVGEVNIDARLIAKGGNIQKEDSDSVISLSNGCACCTLKADLVAQLKQLSDSGKFDYILIEASGAGNPVYLAQTIELMDQALGRKSKTPLVYLDNIITVADAYRFVQEFECGDSIMKEDVDDEDVEKLLIEQLEFCNTVLLNKVDLVSAEELEHVKSVVKALAPEAKLIETTKSAVDMSEVLGTGAFDFEKVASSAGWIKALESNAAEEEEHEHEHHHHDEGETAPECRVHRREEDLHTPALLAEGSDASRNGVRIDQTATSATVIDQVMDQISVASPRQGKHCCAPHLKNRAILFLPVNAWCRFQAHQAAFDGKSVWLWRNPGQSDGDCVDKA